MRAQPEGGRFAMLQVAAICASARLTGSSQEGVKATPQCDNVRPASCVSSLRLTSSLKFSLRDINFTRSDARGRTAGQSSPTLMRH